MVLDRAWVLFARLRWRQGMMHRERLGGWGPVGVMVRGGAEGVVRQGAVEQRQRRLARSRGGDQRESLPGWRAEVRRSVRVMRATKGWRTQDLGWRSRVEGEVGEEIAEGLVGGAVAEGLQVSMSQT